MIIAIVPAAGGSTRMGTTTSKIFLEVKGRCVLSYTVESLVLSKAVNHIVVVGRSHELESARREAIIWKNQCGLSYVEGGNTRQESVGKGIEKAMDLGATLIAVHDGSRPLCAPDKISQVIKRAKENDVAGAILAVQSNSTLKTMKDSEYVRSSVKRHNIFISQTPQVFKAAILERAYKSDYTAEDDSELVEKIGGKIAIVNGSETNIKIITSEDLMLFEALLEVRYKKNEDDHGFPRARELSLVRK